MFLDNLSGDFYGYNHDTEEWEPKGNVGLHASRAEASLQGGVVGGAADLMKKKKVHKAAATSGLKPILIMTSDSDVKVDVRKNFVNHWIFKDVYHEFIVENVNSWDPHPIGITNTETVQKQY
jgi:hypothetical protein